MELESANVKIKKAMIRAFYKLYLLLPAMENTYSKSKDIIFLYGRAQPMGI